MADKKADTSASASASAAAKAPAYGPASESGDPAVHKLLADLETARLNDDDDGQKAAKDALAELGYEAG